MYARDLNIASLSYLYIHVLVMIAFPLAETNCTETYQKMYD